MYARLDVVGDAEARAEGAALEDRRRYEKFIEAGEQFAAAHGLIVGGAAATRLLLGGAPGAAVGRDSYQYDLYSGQAPAHARALGDVMYQLDPQGLGHYTTVLTKVTGYLLTVAVDGRDLFAVTALPAHRGIRVADVVVPSERPAQFAKDSEGAPLRLLCAGPELQLIGVYGALCNPAKAGDWAGHLATEARLRALFAQEIRAKIASAVTRVGGGSRPSPHRLRRALRDKYAAGPGRVLVGPAAIALLTGESVAGEARLQVVTAGRLDGDAQEITALARAAGAEVAWRIDDPKIPTAPRLRRMTVHLVGGGRREPVLDVYNAAGFDLVPYVTLAAGGRRGGRAEGSRPRPAEGSRPAAPEAPAAPEDLPEAPEALPAAPEDPEDWGAPATLKIGTPFVLMRYRLIDMWTMQVLMEMGAVNAGFAKTVLHEMLAGYDAAAAHYEAVLAGAAQDPEAAAHQLLPAAAYIGRLEEPELALKRAAQARSGARFHPPYLPAGRNRADSDAASGGATDGDEAA